jgi:hypothetical protein
MNTWPSFSQMRGDGHRDWYRRSDIIARLREIGSHMTWHDAMKAMSHLPKPEKRYGHLRYTQAHYNAVIRVALHGIGVASYAEEVEA